MATTRYGGVLALHGGEMYIYGGVRLVPAIVAKSFSLGFVESAGDSGGPFVV